MIQPLSAGILAALVGFSSSFTIVLAGLQSAGASADEAASGLLAISLVMGALSLFLSLKTRLPITIVWSTPGAALMIATGALSGGYNAVIGAFIMTALLILIAGWWKAFGRAVTAIPLSLAAAMLAGVLLDLCLAPIRAATALPALTFPILGIFVLALRINRLYAVPLTVLAAVLVMVFAGEIPAEAFANPWPRVHFILPTFTIEAAITLALPLFIVTMASQNVPGFTVLKINGYRAEPRLIFLSTGLGSVGTAFLGGHTLNLAAITAALCAGPEASPEPGQRFIASTACGVTSMLIAPFAGFAAAFIAASPPLLIQAVAGLALFSSLANALGSALHNETERLPAVTTFLVAASGASFMGIGAAFWGLLAGGFLILFIKR